MGPGGFNYGVEPNLKKGKTKSINTEEVLDESKIPEEFLNRPSAEYFLDPDVELAERFTFDKRLRKLPIDSEGKWIRRHKYWRPEDVPDWMWSDADAEGKDYLRKIMFSLDPRNCAKVPKMDLE